MQSQSSDVIYASFWRRTSAHLIDSVLWLLISLPILLWVYGKRYLIDKSGLSKVAEAQQQAEQGSMGAINVLLSNHFMGWIDILINYVLPLFLVVLFWHYRSATPGKMILRVKIVDAESLGKPSIPALILRSFGYLVSLLPLGLGFLWVVFDKRNQSWHDKMAKTLVLWEPKKNSPD